MITDSELIEELASDMKNEYTIRDFLEIKKELNSIQDAVRKHKGFKPGRNSTGNGPALARLLQSAKIKKRSDSKGLQSTRGRIQPKGKS